MPLTLTFLHVIYPIAAFKKLRGTLGARVAHLVRVQEEKAVVTSVGDRD